MTEDRAPARRSIGATAGTSSATSASRPRRRRSTQWSARPAPLPADYRAFLALHNGWFGFSGDHHLLSSEQRTEPGMRASLADSEAIQRELEDPAADGFVIYASESGSDITYLDRSTRGPDGNMDVVRWDPAAREYARYPSFLAYLEGIVEIDTKRLAGSRRR